jgi:hypothetical protein
MVVDRAADQAKPTALDLVNRRRPVTLPEQKLAGSKGTNSAPRLKRGGQIVGGHDRRRQAEGVRP